MVWGNNWRKTLSFLSSRKVTSASLKNYRDIIVFDARVYKALLLYRIPLEREKILRTAFRCLTYSDSTSTDRRSTGKESRGNTNVSWIHHGIWFHTQRKDEADYTCIWSSLRNWNGYNDALQKQNNASITWLLVVWVLWHINLCRLFNAKSIFIKINSSISNNSV